MSKEITTIKTTGKENRVHSLSQFFDLLARFDFEDKQRSEVNTDLSASAPGRSILVSECNSINQ